MQGKKRKNASGCLIIIGGGEDKKGEKVVLGEVARRIGKGRLIVTPVASHDPEGYFEPYNQAFRDLGVKDVVEFDVRERIQANDPAVLQIFDNAQGVFFTGGDQFKITSELGNTLVAHRLREIYESGGVIAGTSAGASAMCETMLVSGRGRESHRIGDLYLAPGLGFIKDVTIDQHFAQRGRMGRLLGTIAQNPRVLGIGIDEDTAIIIEDGISFSVIGSGAVYVVDGTSVTHSNMTEEEADKTLSIYNVTLHVLSRGDGFDMRQRQPLPIETNEQKA